jgi:SWIM zinc finger
VIDPSLAHPAHEPPTRELRALAFYRTRGHEIRQVGGGLYLVPSCTGGGFHSVDYREESCDCPDYLYRGGSCVHILALAIALANGRIVHPELASGDPFIAAARHDDSVEAHYASLEREPEACLCHNGWVFVGRVVESAHDLDGEVVEYERVPCRRCAQRS